MEALSEYEGQSIEECISACLACYQECLGCINHCLILGGEHSEQSHINMMIECAEFCQSAATLLKLNSKFSFEHCQVCARVCDACEQSCRSLGEDSVMQKCADTCRQCAQTCRTMAH